MTNKKEAYEKMTLADLTKLYNDRAGKVVKKLESKAIAIERLLKLDEIPRANTMIHCPGEQKRIPTAGCETRQQNQKNKCLKNCERYVKIKKEAKKIVSKMGLIRQFFETHQKASLEELMSISGFDKKNCQCAMSILKNKGRTPQELRVVTDYNRETQTYILE